MTNIHELVERTELSRWRVQDNEGRHLWHYLEDDADLQDWPITTQDKFHLGISDSEEAACVTQPKTAGQAAANSFKFFSRVQMPSGHWACEFTGPSVSIHGIVIALYVCKIECGRCTWSLPLKPRC